MEREELLKLLNYRDLLRVCIESEEYSELELEEIRLGTASGVDISLYAKGYYKANQMRLIREGLEEGLEVSYYAKKEYKAEQMYVVLEGLRGGVDKEKLSKILGV